MSREKYIKEFDSVIEREQTQFSDQIASHHVCKDDLIETALKAEVWSEAKEDRRLNAWFELHGLTMFLTLAPDDGLNSAAELDEFIQSRGFKPNEWTPDTEAAAQKIINYRHANHGHIRIYLNYGETECKRVKIGEKTVPIYTTRCPGEPVEEVPA